MGLRAQTGSRLLSIDALRGAVMIVMALDHVRDFVHRSAMSSSPTDLTKTTPVLFLTRWITHFCLPIFMFTAGIGAFLWWQRGNHTKGQLSRYLATRGIWFIFLELTVMQFAYNFSISSRYIVLLLILWIFGICMIVMAALVHLPQRWLTIISIAVIVFHNCLDRISSTQFGSSAWAWNMIHQPGVFMLSGRPVLVTYTLLPWIAVMTAGFCFAQVFTLEETARQRIMLRIGLVSTIVFIVMRAVNHYGDPAPWSVQKSVVYTMLSFLNCTKYPASLDFLLMTLGPGLLALAYFDKHPLRTVNPVIVFGRVPFFYFVVHFYLIHLLVVLLAWVRYGNAAFSFIFHPLPSMGGPKELFPANFGYSLWVVYVVWIAVIAVLYPICRWFAGVKARRKDLWWLSYL